MGGRTGIVTGVDHGNVFLQEGEDRVCARGFVEGASVNERFERRRCARHGEGGA